MGRPRDPVSLFERLAQQPFEADFYHTMRSIECAFAERPRWGQALRPADEGVRLGQDPSLAFAPASLSSFVLPKGGRPARLRVNCFGLLGPNGPLPLHLTEFARDRERHEGDETLARFLDVLQHRLTTLFYRAWAQAQPAVSMDRPQDDRFSVYVGALIGLGSSRVRNRDAVADSAKLFGAGWLVRQARNADGLVALLRSYFKLPIALEQFVSHWMELPRTEQTRIGLSGTAILGRSAVLGERVWDRQHRIRIHIGPLGLRDYERFLPGAGGLSRLVAWLRTYLSFELAWDVHLVLKRAEVPAARLGEHGRLGRTAWLGPYEKPHDAGDLVLDPEALPERARQPLPVAA